MDFLDGAAKTVAPRLLGCELERELDGQVVRVRIVETEAYTETDAASHSYRGRTPRTDVMFGPSGHLYVYFTYGMHYCMNIVCGPEGQGAAVLIRAVEPLSGEVVLARNRGGKTGVELTNGPAKLCQALQIDRSMNGHDLSQPPFKLIVKPPVFQKDIVQTTRIGITQARNVPWRFYIHSSSYVSVKSS
jgi:DNA-3-methyladenine glycosylase